MLETLLSYGSDAKASQLTSEMYYKDDAGRMDAFRIREDGGALPNTDTFHLALKFADALAETVTIIAFAEFDNVIKLNRDRNVLVNFSV